MTRTTPLPCMHKRMFFLQWIVQFRQLFPLPRALLYLILVLDIPSMLVDESSLSVFCTYSLNISKSDFHHKKIYWKYLCSTWFLSSNWCTIPTTLSMIYYRLEPNMGSFFLCWLVIRKKSCAINNLAITTFERICGLFNLNTKYHHPSTYSFWDIW